MPRSPRDPLVCDSGIDCLLQHTSYVVGWSWLLSYRPRTRTHHQMLLVHVGMMMNNESAAVCVPDTGRRECRAQAQGTRISPERTGPGTLNENTNWHSPGQTPNVGLGCVPVLVHKCILALEPVRGAFADDDDAVDVATGTDTGLKPNAHAQNSVPTRICSTAFDPEEGHSNGLRNRMLLAFFWPKSAGG